jgi:hypothetical protein
MTTRNKIQPGGKTMQALRKTLIAAALCSAAFTAIASPAAPVPDEPTLPHYMLILPENLPQLTQAMKGRGKELGLSAEQNGNLAAIVLEVRERLQPLFTEARALEKSVASEALAGATPAALAVQLDRLQQLKRQAAEAHIDSINRIRTALSATQYEQLIQLASAARTPADAVARLQGSEQAATELLRLLDGGRYPESWAGASAAFRKGIARDDWAREAANARTPLGTLGSRKLRTLSYATALPNLPAGNYVTLVYDSHFPNKTGVAETVIATREADGVWRLAGYFIQ